ncbi:MAG: protein kinase domain-containing protein, partial [Phycisphaerae bacterium]
MTTTPSDACFPRDELEQFQAGATSESRTRKIAKHVRQCGHCRAEVQRMLDENESLLTRIRNRRDENGEPNVQLTEFLNQLDPQGDLDSDESRARETPGEATDTGRPPRTPTHQAGAAQDVPAGTRYRPIKSLGRGGMGRVMLARDELLERDVAIKRIDERLSSDLLLREARAAARLQHPHIVQVYDVVSDDGIDYIIMEYLAGGDLQDLIRRQAKLPIVRVVRIGIDLCNALDYAQANGITHRDIKPSNVLVGQNATVKLADFGVALNLAHNPDPVDVAGTKHYMAPEILERRVAADETADVYSLGVTLYELATHVLPPETVADSDSSSTRINELPDDVIRVLKKAYAANRDERYPSFRTLRDALTALESTLLRDTSVMHCRVCGQELQASDRCNACHTPIILLTMNCHACDTTVSLDFDACPKCGVDLTASAVQGRHILDAVRQADQSDWRQARDALNAMKASIDLPAEALSVLTGLDERAQKIDAWESQALASQAAGHPHEAIEWWERILAADQRHPTAGTRVATLEAELANRRHDALRDEIASRLDNDDIEGAEDYLKALTDAGGSSEQNQQLRKQIEEHKQGLVRALQQEGLDHFKAEDFYAALVTLDRAQSLADDGATRRSIRNAIRIVEQREKLQRLASSLDRNDTAGASKLIAQVSPEHLSGDAIDMFQKSRQRLERINTKRRLRKLAIGGAVLLVMVATLAFILPGTVERVSRWNVGMEGARRTTLQEAIAAKLDEALRSSDPAKRAIRAARTLRLIDVANGRSSDWYTAFLQTSLGHGQSSQLRNASDEIIPAAGIYVDADARQEIVRLVDSIEWHESSLEEVQELGRCSRMVCEGPTDWLASMIDLGERDAAPDGSVDAGKQPLGSLRARQQLDELLQWVKAYEKNDTQINHENCHEHERRILFLEHSSPFLDRKEAGRLSHDISVHQEDEHRQVINKMNLQLAQFEMEGSPAESLLQEWHDRTEEILSCPAHERLDDTNLVREQ